MRQYASTHLTPGDTPEVDMIGRGHIIGRGHVIVAVGGDTVLVARPDILRTFCASIIAQIDALDGGDAA